MFKSKLKELLKKIPILKSAIRFFRNPGNWLYHISILSWMFIPNLNKQLPPLYRFFAEYCKLMGKVRDNIIAGRYVFHFVSVFNRFFSRVQTLQLVLPCCVVYVNLKDPRFMQVVSELLNKNSDITIFTSFMSEGDTLVDIGANHGSFSILASKVLGKNGLVVSIEPQPLLAKLINKSLEANLNCRYQVHQIALGDSNGEVNFFVPHDTSGCAGIFASHSASHKHSIFKVPLRRLDDAFEWLNFPGSVFVKLDIEGSEYEFLKGAKEMLKNRKPYVMVEVHPETIKASGVSNNAMKNLLIQIGYRYFIELDNISEAILLRNLDTDRQRNILIVPLNFRK